MPRAYRVLLIFLFAVLFLVSIWLPLASSPSLSFTVANSNDSGVRSLRWAINQANGNPGPDTISFAIPGVGLYTIPAHDGATRVSDDGTTLDGYTQSGAAPATDTTAATIRIQIDCSSLPPGTLYGLRVTGSHISVRGLAINHCEGVGLAIDGANATGNVVAGNDIGTNVAGNADLGNGASGVFIGLGAHDNTIGGPTPADCNLPVGQRMGRRRHPRRRLHEQYRARQLHRHDGQRSLPDWTIHCLACASMPGRRTTRSAAPTSSQATARMACGLPGRTPPATS